MTIDVQRVLERRRQGDSPAGEGDWLSRLGLRFRSDLEEAYLRELTERRVPVVYLSLLLALIFMLVFLGYDLVTLGRYAQAWIYLLVFGVCGGSALLAVIYLLRRKIAGYPQWLPLSVAAANGAALVAAAVMASTRHMHWPYEIIFVTFLYTFFFLGLSFRCAAPLALAVVLGFGLGQARAGLAPVDLIEQTFLLFMIAVLCAAAGYLQERIDRESWLRGQRIHELSQRDALTDLLNHRSFFERAEASFRQARREKKNIAVVLGDVDHFKKFNDTHGHMSGDLCLRRVAGLMANTARRPLDLVARLGGEEFAILFYGAEADWVMGHVEDLRAQIAWMDMGDHAGLVMRTSISLGLAFYTPEGIPSVELALRQADAALYRAKNSGRDRISI